MVRSKTGDEPTIASIVDAAYGDDRDHFLRHVEPEDFDVLIRHDAHVETDVVDGVVVHKVFESYDRDADAESLSWSSYPACPCDDHPRPDREYDHDDESGTVTETWSCDECPFEVRRASEGSPTHPDSGKTRPLWYRATVPAGCLDTDFDVDKWEATTEDMDTDDVVTYATIVRRLSLRRYTYAIRDDAHVSAEYEGEGDDREKVADAYIDTFECGNCGDTHDAPAKKTHPVFGDVCPACEDVETWSPDDADLPDDVVDRMAAHKSFGASNIVALLRDVIYWGNYRATVDDQTDGGLFDTDDPIDPEDVGPIHTGKQGRHGTGRGDGEPGTGFRRPSGAAHNKQAWRTVVEDAWETGLIDRADDGDVAFDDPNARWRATDKGRDVFDALARCRTCGDRVDPFLRVSTYKVGRSTKKDYTLTTACPSCDAGRSKPVGGMVIESSGGDWSNLPLRGVAYDDE